MPPPDKRQTALKACGLAVRTHQVRDALGVVDTLHKDALWVLAQAAPPLPPTSPFTSFIPTALQYAVVAAETLAERADVLLAHAQAQAQAHEHAHAPTDTDTSTTADTVTRTAADTDVLTACNKLEDDICALEACVERVRTAANCVEQRLQDKLEVPAEHGAEADAVVQALFEQAHCSWDCSLLAMCLVHPRFMSAVTSRVCACVWERLNRARVPQSFARAVLEYLIDARWGDVSDTPLLMRLVDATTADGHNDMFDALVALPGWRWRPPALDVNARDSLGRSVLVRLVTQRNVKALSLQRMRALLELPAMTSLDVNTLCPCKGLTALALATESHNATLVGVLLESPLKARFDVNLRLDQHDTPLLRAVRHFNVKAVRALLQHRVCCLRGRAQWDDFDFNARGFEGNTALELAVKLHQTKVVLLLTQKEHATCHGWDDGHGFDVVTQIGLSAYLMSSNDIRKGIVPLVRAMWTQGHGSTHGRLLFPRALDWDHPWLARYALRGSTEETLQDNDNFTAQGACQALQYESLAVFKACLEAEAPAFDVNAFFYLPNVRLGVRHEWRVHRRVGSTAGAETLLMRAVHHDMAKFVQVLLDLPAARGLDVHLKNSAGSSALDAARGQTRKLLLQRGYPVGADTSTALANDTDAEVADAESQEVSEAASRPAGRCAPTVSASTCCAVS